MKEIRHSILNVLWQPLLVIGCVLSVCLPIYPKNMPCVYRDSGVFLYTGWRIINGASPYQDIWDHKPPLIFYIDALGLSISQGQRWGVWLIEFLSLLLAAFVCFLLLKKSFGKLPAVIGLIYGFITLNFFLEGGNLTTEFTLPLQFIALWMVSKSIRPGKNRLIWLIMGFTCGLAFFTKQTAIGLWIATVLYSIFLGLKRHDYSGIFSKLSFFAMGFLGTLIIFLVFFFVHGSFADFWNESFVYNFHYIAGNGGILTKLILILHNMSYLDKFGLLLLPMLGCLVSIFSIFRSGRKTIFLPAILLISLIDLPIEYMLINLSSSSSLQYHMTLIPSLTVITGYFFFSLFFFARQFPKSKIVSSAIAVLLVFLMLLNSIPAYIDQVNSYRTCCQGEIIDYITANTTPVESVLLWGAETSVNFASQRQSPSRFVYQYPLYKKGYTDEGLIIEYLNDIIQNKPQLIIDTKNFNTPFLDFPITSLKIDDEIDQIKRTYLLVGEINHWDIYRYTSTHN